MPPIRTTVTLMTPPGRGAIATLAIRGPQAVAAVEHCFHAASGKPFSSFATQRIVFGDWQSDTAQEELVVARVGAEEVEVQCHGGRSATTAIIASLKLQGVEEASTESFIAEDDTDYLAAEAHLALTSARTERTAQHLLAQYQGTLRRALDEIIALVQKREMKSASQLIDTLLARGPCGLHLTEPWRVVLAGEPNVGKSSLMNALVGYSRSIVFAEPGTTRDIVSALTAFDGWPVELLDTAGLRAASDELESAGVLLAEAQLAKADLVLLVADATKAWPTEYNELLTRLPNVILVLNKADLIANTAFTMHYEHGVVSAMTGAGILQLGDWIAQRLVPHPPALNSAIPFTPRQLRLLASAQQAASMCEIALACSLLQSLTTGDSEPPR